MPIEHPNTQMPYIPTSDPELHHLSNADNLSNADIDKLIRGEQSALEAYEQVMKSIPVQESDSALKRIRMHHRDAVSYWKNQARTLGKLPEAGSGVWGGFVETFVGTAKILSHKLALKSLEKGEKHGQHLYETMLSSEELSDEQKSKIAQFFIPQQNAHTRTLAMMIENAA